MNRSPDRSSPPPDDEALWPPGFRAWIKLALCYQRGSRLLSSLLRPLGLTVPQFDALANLYVGDGITQQQLARRLLVTKGNVTGLLDRLAERGLVERRADPTDRRANRIALTEQGRALAQRSLEVQHALVAELMGVLDADEQEQLRLLLARIVTQLERLGDDPPAA